MDGWSGNAAAGHVYHRGPILRIERREILIGGGQLTGQSLSLLGAHFELQYDESISRGSKLLSSFIPCCSRQRLSPPLLVLTQFKSRIEAGEEVLGNSFRSIKNLIEYEFVLT